MTTALDGEMRWKGRAPLESLPLAPCAAQQRQDLLKLLDSLDGNIAGLRRMRRWPPGIPNWRKLQTGEVGGQPRLRRANLRTALSLMGPWALPRSSFLPMPDYDLEERVQEAGLRGCQVSTRARGDAVGLAALCSRGPDGHE
jgi:hypothetical protein